MTSTLIQTRRVGSRAETARALASAGALVTFAVRSTDVGDGNTAD
jgi:hypothetical protein